MVAVEVEVYVTALACPCPACMRCLGGGAGGEGNRVVFVDTTQHSCPCNTVLVTQAAATAALKLTKDVKTGQCDPSCTHHTHRHAVIPPHVVQVIEAWTPTAPACNDVTVTNGDM